LISVSYPAIVSALFYSREQRAKRHAKHLVTAARVKYHAALLRCRFDTPLLAAGSLIIIAQFCQEGHIPFSHFLSAIPLKYV